MHFNQFSLQFHPPIHKADDTGGFSQIWNCENHIYAKSVLCGEQSNISQWLPVTSVTGLPQPKESVCSSPQFLLKETVYRYNKKFDMKICLFVCIAFEKFSPSSDQKLIAPANVSEIEILSKSLEQQTQVRYCQMLRRLSLKFLLHINIFPYSSYPFRNYILKLQVVFDLY